MMMIELLLSNGGDINVRIESGLGYTVLMKLVSSEILDKEKLFNLIEIIQFLIERGADKTLKGYDGKTVQDIAMNSNFEEDILKVINNSKQIYFYNNNNTDFRTSESNQLKKKNDFYDTNIIKSNCFNNCNIL